MPKYTDFIDIAFDSDYAFSRCMLCGSDPQETKKYSYDSRKWYGKRTWVSFFRARKSISLTYKYHIPFVKN
jgi:hypothetical protein